METPWLLLGGVKGSTPHDHIKTSAGNRSLILESSSPAFAPHLGERGLRRGALYTYLHAIRLDGATAVQQINYRFPLILVLEESARELVRSTLEILTAYFLLSLSSETITGPAEHPYASLPDAASAAKPKSVPEFSFDSSEQVIGIKLASQELVAHSSQASPGQILDPTEQIDRRVLDSSARGFMQRSIQTVWLFNQEVLPDELHFEIPVITRSKGALGVQIKEGGANDNAVRPRRIHLYVTWRFSGKG